METGISVAAPNPPPSLAIQTSLCRLGLLPGCRSGFHFLDEPTASRYCSNSLMLSSKPLKYAGLHGSGRRQICNVVPPGFAQEKLQTQNFKPRCRAEPYPLEFVDWSLS